MQIWLSAFSLPIHLLLLFVALNGSDLFYAEQMCCSEGPEVVCIVLTGLLLQPYKVSKNYTISAYRSANEGSLCGIRSSPAGILDASHANRMP
jgi:hypothetical protein